LYEERIGQNPESISDHSLLGLTYALLGRNEQAVAKAEEVVKLINASQDAFRSPVYYRYVAQIYVVTEEFDRAVDWLAYSLAIPSAVAAGHLRVHPDWDPLRDHPRFQALLEKYDTEQ
jgi:serine/threonine-protein kinase